MLEILKLREKIQKPRLSSNTGHLAPCCFLLQICQTLKNCRLVGSPWDTGISQISAKSKNTDQTQEFDSLYVFHCHALQKSLVDACWHNLCMPWNFWETIFLWILCGPNIFLRVWIQGYPESSNAPPNWFCFLTGLWILYFTSKQ